MENEDFKEVCSWCGKVVKEGSPGAKISHVMCWECEEKQMTEMFNQRKDGYIKMMNGNDGK